MHIECVVAQSPQYRMAWKNRYGRKAPNCKSNFLRNHQFKKTGSLCKKKSSGQPSVSEEAVERKEKSKGLRSGEFGGQTGLPRPVHLPEYVAWRWFAHRNQKIYWCEVTGIPFNNSGRSEKFVYVLDSSIRPRYSKSPHSFGHFPRLAHPPTDGYYYCDFDRQSEVCDPMSCGDLSSLCCLLSAL
ncbi:hypothetical protein TNCV_1849151 [Trichonephila clavipes]|nr:hypothetical protein TNCV_1849151 [Trichonephila clavipes]